MRKLLLCAACIFLFTACGKDKKPSFDLNEKIEESKESVVPKEETMEFFEYNTMTDSERDFFDQITKFYDLIVPDSVKRISILESDELSYIQNEIVYSLPLQSDEDEVYTMYSMTYSGNVGQDMYINYKYRSNFNEEVKGSIIVFNGDMIHTKYACDQVSCAEMLWKNDKLIYEKATKPFDVTTSLE